MALNPEDSLSSQNRGDALCLLGDFKEAIRAYEKAIELELDMLDADAWYNKGLALKAAERYPEADEALLTALALREL